MSWFSRIEERCALFIERAFANMFPSDLEPVHIARKLVATMEARTRTDDGAITAPALYVVCVSIADYARLEEHREYLEREWAALLSDVAGRVGIRLSGPPGVRMEPQERVAPGAFEVHAQSAAEPAFSPARYRLERIAGPAPENAFFVDGAARVGRSPQCDVVLADPSVSRSHALLDVRNGKLYVQDTASTNGTWVNGERVETRVLQPGDTIAFGKTILRVGPPS